MTKVKTIPQVLKDHVTETIDKQNLGETEYFDKVRKKMDPDGDNYKILALYDDGDGLGFDLKEFVKVDWQYKPKFILAKTHDDKCDDSSDDANASYSLEEKYGDEFGITWNREKEWFEAEKLELFGSEFGAGVYFDRLGIKKEVGDPIKENIDIADEYEGMPNVEIYAMGDNDGEHGDFPIVKIEGNTIYSKIPVYVHGTSSDWTLDGRFHEDNDEPNYGNDINMTNWPNDKCN